MRNVANDFTPDGSFDCDDKTILYRITDDSRPIRTVNGIEKMSRFITFYESTGDTIGTTSVYDTYDRMTNITHFDALEWYKEFIQK